jgi:hypothetical protein
MTDTPIRRTLCARKFNAVANDPEVRPWIGGEGPLDLSAVIANPANYALEGAHGGWVFARHEAGVYELHTLIAPAGRGWAAMRGWRAAERYLFSATDAREIVTRVPAHNEAAAWAAQLCGFRERFSRKDAFRAHTGQLVDVSYRARTIDDWWPRDHEAHEAGRVFHAQIETAKALADSALPDHPEDATHDQAAGAACLMIGAGNPRKGVWFYNRWAALAGYPPIQMISEAPLTIDTGAGVFVEVRGGIMEVIQCP